MKLSQTEPTRCPSCGISSSPTWSKGPEVGNYAVCLSCGALAIFGTDLHQRKPTDSEFEAGLAIPEIVIVMARIQKINRNN